MNIRKARRVGIPLGVISAVALGLAAGCLDAPVSTNQTDEPLANTAVCDPVSVLSTGSLYRVSVTGSAPVKIVDQLNMPWEVTVDNGTLYFTEDGVGDCTGKIRKLSAAAPAGTASTELLTGLNRPRRPVIHQGYLYFAEYAEGGSINRVKLDAGGKEILLEGLNRPFGLAVDSNDNYTYVYFTETGTEGNSYRDGTLKIIQLGNADGIVTGPVTMADNLKMPIGLVMDPYYAYVAEMNAGRVFRISKTAPVALIEDLMTGLSTPYPPVLEDPTPDDPADGKNILYFADFNSADFNAGKVYKLSNVDQYTTPRPVDSAATCAAPNCILLADSLNWPMLVAVDGTNIYWSEVYNAAVRGIRKDASPTEPFELTSGNLDFEKPLGIATDGVNVYFTDIGNNTCCF